MMQNKALTATAEPDKGYEFSGWTVQQSSDGKKMVERRCGKYPQFGSKHDSHKQSNQFLTKPQKKYFQITPTFSKRIKITLVPNSADKGSVTCTTEKVDLNSFLPGSNTLALVTTVKEGCSLTGWSVTYADGTAVPETAAKVTPDIKKTPKTKQTKTRPDPPPQGVRPRDRAKLFCGWGGPHRHNWKGRLALQLALAA